VGLCGPSNVLLLETPPQRKIYPSKHGQWGVEGRRDGEWRVGGVGSGGWEEWGGRVGGVGSRGWGWERALDCH